MRTRFGALFCLWPMFCHFPDDWRNWWFVGFRRVLSPRLLGHRLRKQGGSTPISRDFPQTSAEAGFSTPISGFWPRNPHSRRLFWGYFEHVVWSMLSVVSWFEGCSNQRQRALSWGRVSSGAGRWALVRPASIAVDKKFLRFCLLETD